MRHRDSEDVAWLRYSTASEGGAEEASEQPGRQYRYLASLVLKARHYGYPNSINSKC